MNYKKITALVLAVLMLLSTLVSCRKVGENDSTSNTSSDTTTNYSNVDIIENESEPQSLIDTTSEDGSSESGGSTDDRDNNDKVNSGNGGNTGNGSNSGNNSNNGNTGNSGNSGNSANNGGSNIKDTNDTNNNDDSGATGNEKPPEIPEETVVLSGKGTSVEPYEGYLSEDGTFLTNEIPAGKSFFYNIRGIANRILIIDNAGAYVVYNGERYNADSNGKVSFFIESDAQDGDFVKLEIGNSGSKAEEFPVVFEFLKGSLGAPEKISSITNSIKHSLAEGNADGYVFRYTAEKAGTIRFYLLSGTKKGQLMVSNIRNSATRSTESLEEGEVKTDDVGTYVELEVKKGDDINITIGIKPNSRNQYKATDIEFLLKYS